MINKRRFILTGQLPFPAFQKQPRRWRSRLRGRSGRRGLCRLWCAPGAAGEGVVHDGAKDSSRCHVFDLVPFRAGETHVGEALATGEDDTSVLVVPGVIFILSQDGKLNSGLCNFRFFVSLIVHSSSYPLS
jgi:hypothetical protein